MKFEILSEQAIPQISHIVATVQSQLSLETIERRLIEMFGYANYRCFGLFDETKLIAICSGWILTKIYSGKQLELDNFAVDENYRSQGIGKQFEIEINNWAKDNGIESIELNTYVANSGSHKFYFNQGYKIIGYHFQKDS